MKKNSGQITVEAVLIIAILVSTMVAGTRVLKDQKILSKMVEAPWQHLAGMIENGVWGAPELGKGKHPNHMNRHGSPRGDTP